MCFRTRRPTVLAVKAGIPGLAILGGWPPTRGCDACSRRCASIAASGWSPRVQVHHGPGIREEAGVVGTSVNGLHGGYDRREVRTATALPSARWQPAVGSGLEKAARVHKRGRAWTHRTTGL